MKRILSFLLWSACLSAPLGLSAQSYSALLIPDSLLKDSRAVQREEDIQLEIKSPSRAIIRRRHVYTILNESADSKGFYGSVYNKFHSINSISGTLYDAMGKELKHVKKKDMSDGSNVSEDNLIDDSRYKAYDFYYRTYPYTVAFEEEDELNGILGFPNWSPLSSSGISTQHSKYTVIAPKDYQVRYKLVNYAAKPVITESGDKRIYTWEVADLPARFMERSGPEWEEIAPHVLLAPSDFEADGYKGNMSTWENYGKFINQLRVGRDALPENIKKKVHELTDNLKDSRQKVYALYDFLQKNTHYISIQLGIGGWQPFPAEYVATKLYGDCKALSNYMVALLKEAGITGKYVEIWSGKDAPDLVEDFPCSQGDHVISCVPLGKDTIWLECTSQTESPGYMGSFTGERKAILIDESGGHIVRTPSYSSTDNLQSRVVTATISGEGNLDADVNTIYSGIRQEGPHDLMNASGDQREKYLNRILNLPTYNVEKSHYVEQRGSLPVMKEYLHVLSPGYASVSGKRLFITPNLFNKSGARLPADSARKYDFVYKEGYKEIDSITLSIPAGYSPESIPQDVHIDTKFGRYNASVKVQGDKITYYRSNEKIGGRFPASDYAGIVKFYEQLYKADHSRVVLVKNN
jgi:transglutaminase-like putative cysteine protease